MTVAPLFTKSQPPMLVAWKAAFLKNYSVNLRLNATRRTINLSEYLVFDLEAGELKFLGENLLGAGAVENELSTLDSFL